MHDLGRELRVGGTTGGNGDTRWRGAEGENWDNCNSIIDKIHLEREREREMS